MTNIFVNSLSFIVPAIVEPDYKTAIPDANLRRRMSRLVRMGVAAGLECIDAMPDDVSKKIDGVITSSGLGFLTDTMKFADAIEDQEERMLNPTPFIQSTFNTVGAQIAILRGLHCYNTTYVNRGDSFTGALTDGILALEEGAENVLVGGFDEMTPASEVLEKRLGLFGESCQGEGAGFVMLSSSESSKSVGRILGVRGSNALLEKITFDAFAKDFLRSFGLRSEDVRMVRADRAKTGDYQTVSAAALCAEIQNCEGKTLICSEFADRDRTMILIDKVR